jgi:hypothetical protein
LPRLFRLPIIAGLAWLGGIVWQGVVYSIFLNPVLGTFSVPLDWIWIAGGLCSLTSTITSQIKSFRSRWTIEIAILIGVSMTFGFSRPLLDTLFFDRRTVEITWIRWKPDSGPTRFNAFATRSLTSEGLSRLAALNLGGYLEVQQIISRGEGPVVRVVIIIQKPINDSIQLQIPSQDTVVFVQQSDGTWQTSTTVGTTLQQTIVLEQDSSNTDVTRARLTFPGGNYLSIGGINWRFDSSP